jgi:hypothetical protein
MWLTRIEPTDKVGRAKAFTVALALFFLSASGAIQRGIGIRAGVIDLLRLIGKSHVGGGQNFPLRSQ